PSYSYSSSPSSSSSSPYSSSSSPSYSSSSSFFNTFFVPSDRDGGGHAIIERRTTFGTQRSCSP
ncbi:unnamed protein product, partial [Schistocephalus solidus]|uniref:Secreted protein n=1 Tax=Schistocephalus solidus TaxID=70667 RepID=A0A183TG41_SCHSO